MYQLLNTVIIISFDLEVNEVEWEWEWGSYVNQSHFVADRQKLMKNMCIHYFIWHSKNRNPTQLLATRRSYETLLTEVSLNNIWSIEVTNFYLHCIERENYVSGSNSERIVNQFSRVRNLSDVPRCMAPHLTVFFIKHRAWTFDCDWS